MHVHKLYHPSTHNGLPKDEHWDSKHVQEVVKIKILMGSFTLHFGLKYEMIYQLEHK